MARVKRKSKIRMAYSDGSNCYIGGRAFANMGVQDGGSVGLVSLGGGMVYSIGAISAIVPNSDGDVDGYLEPEPEENSVADPEE